MSKITGIKISTHATEQVFRDQKRGHGRAQQLAAAEVVFSMELVDLDEQTEADKLRNFIAKQDKELLDLRNKLSVKAKKKRSGKSIEKKP